MNSSLIFYSNQWASGKIRAEQVAARGGWDVVESSASINANDILILVKALPNDECIATNKGGIYIDIVDAYGMIPWLREHPEVGIISISNLGTHYLKEHLSQAKDIRFIPEHHCNFNRFRKEFNGVKTVGYIGERENFCLPFDSIKGYLRLLGYDFVWQSDFKTREDIIAFYAKIDVQLTFRDDRDEYGRTCALLKNPLKLENAGSFGIPSISFPEATYQDEWEGYFMPAANADAISYWLDRLKNEDGFYEEKADLAYEKAEEYHIDKIIPLYQNLLTTCVEV